MVAGIAGAADVVAGALDGAEDEAGVEVPGELQADRADPISTATAAVKVARI